MSNTSDPRGNGPSHDDGSGPADYGRGRYPEPTPPRAGTRTALVDATPDEAFWDYEDYDERDWVRIPRPSGVGRRIAAAGLLLALLIVGIVGYAGFWVYRQVNPAGDPGPEIEIAVPAGATTAEIAVILDENAVVSNGRIFQEYVRIRDAGPFQAGDYTFAENSPMGDALEVLAAGPAEPEFFQVTIPEGLTVEQIAAQLAEQVPDFELADVQAAMTSGQVQTPFLPEGQTSLEGLLFPDTYQFEEGATPLDVLNRMSQEMVSVATELGLEEAAATYGYTPYELLIMASMLEREVRLPEEHGMVARVLYNRIGAQMTLGIDATVRYAVDKPNEPLTVEDLDVDSPYNTRKYQGLPPTPIAVPSRSAIAAVISPTEGPWLFYVLADEEGHHFFTDSYDEFLRQRDISREAGLL
ncbi:MAG: endolytic transglycosylase MltG [Actinomycetota bacterium]|nr:endolytic transglycosylase MltG [Actinomycetota bacterium]